MTMWYVGQKIVCVVEKDTWIFYGGIRPSEIPDKGAVYTIEKIVTEPMGGSPVEHSPWFTLKEMRGPAQYSNNGFKPLEEAHNEMFRKMVTPEELKLFKEPSPLEKSLERLRENR